MKPTRLSVPALACTLLTLASLPLRAQEPPAPADVLGHDVGERFTPVSRVHDYALALAGASARVTYRVYGRTPEGRPLGILVLSSEENLRRLDATLADLKRLADPGLPVAEAARIAHERPAVAWFTYGVHGDEASSPEAAMLTAWDLARSADGTEGVLDSLVVVLDPVANPDGRDRYVQWYRQVRGADPDPDPSSAEHRPPWPGGRLNHFLFDLNRDWVWATQPETRDRLAEWARWHPQVHVDFHEMGVQSTYFFFPAASPVSPLYPDYTLRWAEYFGRANAAEFDRRGWLYFSRERFDLFYPGYGDSWPSLVGAIGMTYEQAGGGSAGLAVRRDDGTVLTLAERAEHHRIAGLVTLRAAARRKTELLQEYAAFHRGLASGLPDVLLVPGPSVAALDALVAELGGQGIAVERAVRPFRATARPHPGFDAREDFPPGTIRVRSGQSRGRLALTLLQPEVELDQASAETTYDVSGWSLPYAYGVEAHLSEAGGGRFEAVPVLRPATATRRGPAGGSTRPYGWLVPPTPETAGPVWRFLQAGGRAIALEHPFRIGARQWPAGTRFLPADSGAATRLDEAGLGTLVEAVTSGRVEDGRDLGTGSSLVLRPSRIGLLRGAGLRPTSVGAAWRYLESEAGIGFHALDVGSLSRVPLDEFDVLVLPDGAPARALDASARDALETWVRGGGTLVAFGGSARWAGGELAGVEAREPAPDSLTGSERLSRALRTREERRSDTWDEAATGVVLPLRLDPSHPLAWGAGLGNEGRRLFVLHTEDLSFEPRETFETVASFASDVQAVSGVAGEEPLRRLSESSWLVASPVGRGRVILFADDPLFRLMWPSLFVLFTNALLYGPVMR